jgi:hypothetical protein
VKFLFIRSSDEPIETSQVWQNFYRYTIYEMGRRKPNPILFYFPLFACIFTMTGLLYAVYHRVQLGVNVFEPDLNPTSTMSHLKSPFKHNTEQKSMSDDHSTLKEHRFRSENRGKIDSSLPYEIAWPSVQSDLDLKSYPVYDTLLNVIRKWNPDVIPETPFHFVETLQHFNYSDPTELDIGNMKLFDNVINF